MTEQSEEIRLGNDARILKGEKREENRENGGMKKGKAKSKGNNKRR
jgi:hypothetical protein